MNPEQATRAREAATAAMGLAEVIGSDRPVAQAAATLAAACLELSVAPFAWSPSHDLVRDLGVDPVRRALAGDGTAALRLAAAAISRLAVHAMADGAGDSLAERLERLATALSRSARGMDACELEIVARLEEPRLAEISLARRRESLRSVPTSHRERLERLAREVQALERSLAESRTSVSSLEAGLAERQRTVRDLSDESARLQREIEGLDREIRSLRAGIDRLEHERSDRTNERDRAAERIRSVREELESHRDDPRDRIREAVRRALSELPDDLLDRGVRGAHVR